MMDREELKESIRTILKADPKQIDKINNKLLREEAEKVRSL